MDRNIDTFDVCIIGGSIAGNYLCYLLSKTNLKVLVIEEHKEIGYPLQCAGILSQKLSKLIDLPKEIILNRVNTAKEHLSYVLNGHRGLSPELRTRLFAYLGID